MEFSQDEIEAGADALRRFEMASKGTLVEWHALHRHTRARWRSRAVTVLEAVARERKREYDTGWEADDAHLHP